MKLLIDIGNTNTSIALSEGGKIKKRYFIHTSKKAIETKPLKRLFGRYLRGIDKIVLVSVVPSFLAILKGSLKKVFPDVPLFIVGKDITVPIKVNYKNPGEVGQDRLVAAFSASSAYGPPILIIDFGTAVTFDFVNRRGEYEGGLIFPGLRLALSSLSKNAALLPKIELKSVKGLIGRDTKSSMNKGIIFGYAAACDGIIERFRKKYGKGFKIVATGGDAALIARYTRHIEKISSDLIFRGLISLN